MYIYLFFIYLIYFYFKAKRMSINYHVHKSTKECFSAFQSLYFVTATFANGG